MTVSDEMDDTKFPGYVADRLSSVLIGEAAG